MELLALFKEGVVLRQSLQGQLICNLDILWVGHITLLELTNFNWISCTEQANLATLRAAHLQDLLDHFLELSGN